MSLTCIKFVKASAGEIPVVGNTARFGVTPLSVMTVAFPAPLTFLTQRVLEQIAAEWVNVANRLAQLTAERSDSTTTRRPGEAGSAHGTGGGQWPPDVNVAVIHDPSTNPPTLSEYDVAGARAYLAGLREHLANLGGKGRTVGAVRSLTEQVRPRPRRVGTVLRRAFAAGRRKRHLRARFRLLRHAEVARP